MFNEFGPSAACCRKWRRGSSRWTGIDLGGRLFVSGPNMMLGDLRAEHPGVFERRRRWHDAGDIVTIDDAGLYRHRGPGEPLRQIGGDTIPLGAVEALAAELWPTRCHGAATVPTARGRRLILVTTKNDPKRSDFLAYAHAAAPPR